MTRIKLILFFVLAHSFISFSQSEANNSLSQLEIRIKQNEEELERQKREYSLQERELKQTSKEEIDRMNQEFSTLSKSLNDKYSDLNKELKDEYTFLRNIAWSGISITFLTLLGYFWKGKKYIEKRISEKFDRIIEDKASNILDVVNKNDLEKQILLKRKILILSPQAESSDFVKKFFTEVGFQIDHLNYKNGDSYDDHGDHDLIFINNDKGHFNHDIIEQYYKKSSPKTMLFYFNTTAEQYRTSEPLIQNRLSFANSRTQIYGNLINLLKYQEIIN